MKRDSLLPFAAAVVLAWAILGVRPSQTQAGESKPTVEKIYGRIQFVDSFPDHKVQVVNSFPDLKVQKVTNFPDAPGRWQIVDSHPDYKIQIVNSFPDFRIQYVDSFPGPAN